MIVFWIQILLIIATLMGGVVYTLKPFDYDKNPRAMLRIGVVPSVNRERVKQRYAPLQAYLSEEVGLPVELVIPADYQGLMALFAKKKVDLALFGGSEYVTAMIQYDANPLVMRNIDTHFTSSFIVSAASTATSLTDFKGHKLAFGNPLSTSGHVMPRHFLYTTYTLKPEQFFSEVAYAGAHDKTAYQVRDGLADLGAINTYTLKNMFSDGRLNQEDVRTLWETPPYVNYVWSLQKDVDVALEIALRNAFLSLDHQNPTHKLILDNLNAEYFLPAGRSDYRLLAESPTRLPRDAF